MTYMDRDEPGLRAVINWHRRSGKDDTCLNQMIKRMVLAPYCGTYPYIFPSLTQGRRNLWDAKSSPDSGGQPFRSHFPPELVMESSETEMQITLRPLPNQKPQPIPDGKGGQKFVGSVFQVMGTDRDSIENLRGMNAVGVVFSEYSKQDPTAWTTIIEPILMETKGWAIFNFTPEGKNHAFTLYQMAERNPAWFAETLTVDQTYRDEDGGTGTHVVTPEQIAALREEGIAEEIIQQEYYCSFEGYLHGSIFGDLIKLAEKDKRIGQVPWVTALPVGTMWDIGRTDATAIWFYQCVGSEIRFIDYYANVRQGADHYAKVCRQKPYLYGKMILPHDAKVKGYTSTQSTEEFLRETVCRNAVIAEKLSVQSGIDIARRMMSRCIFDREHCDTQPNPGVPSGLDGLRSYARKWDVEKNDYSGEPVHNAFSHPADAFRTGMVGWEEGMHFSEFKPVELKVESTWDLQEAAMEWR